MRIFEFCINHARQIIAELETSGGDHSEDVHELQGLIEVWEYLHAAANEDHKLEQYRSTNAKGR